MIFSKVDVLFFGMMLTLSISKCYVNFNNTITRLLSL